MYANYVRKGVSIIVALAVFLSLAAGMTVEVNATSSKTKKMVVYNQIVKKGKYAYCISNHKSIYRVNLKTGKSKKLVKVTDSDMGVDSMRIYKGNIYYHICGGLMGNIWRIRTNGKHNKWLASGWDYVIVKNKIYFNTYSTKKDKDLNLQMSLSGKNKKRSKTSAQRIDKESNVKGYRIKSLKRQNGYYVDYLVMPNKKTIRICKYKN